MADEMIESLDRKSNPILSEEASVSTSLIGRRRFVKLLTAAIAATGVALITGRQVSAQETPDDPETSMLTDTGDNPKTVTEEQATETAPVPNIEVGKKDVFGYVTQEDGSTKYGDLALGYEIIDETKGTFHIRIVPRTPQLEQQFREMAADNMKKNPVDNFPTRIRYLYPDDPRWENHKVLDFIMGDETSPNSVKLYNWTSFYYEDNGKKIVETWISFDKDALTPESLNKVQEVIKPGTQVPLVLGGDVGFGPGITISDPAARVLLDQAPFTLAWGDFSKPETIQTLNPVSH